MSWSTVWSKASSPSNQFADWHREDINITNYIGHIIQVRFLFDSIDDCCNEHEGWYVDNIFVHKQVSKPPTVVLGKIVNLENKFTGISNRGPITLEFNVDAKQGTLEILNYPSTHLSFTIKITEEVTYGNFIYIKGLINYKISSHDNWLPVTIIIDNLDNKAYLFGPINALLIR